MFKVIKINDDENIGMTLQELDDLLMTGTFVVLRFGGDGEYYMFYPYGWTQNDHYMFTNMSSDEQSCFIYEDGSIHWEDNDGGDIG